MYETLSSHKWFMIDCTSLKWYNAPVSSTGALLRTLLNPQKTHRRSASPGGTISWWIRAWMSAMIATGSWQKNDNSNLGPVEILNLRKSIVSEVFDKKSHNQIQTWISLKWLVSKHRKFVFCLWSFFLPSVKHCRHSVSSIQTLWRYCMKQMFVQSLFS